jgi:hypothetical protein
MSLIIEELAGLELVEYSFTGAITTTDLNLITMDFTAKNGPIRGEFNLRGLIDMPLQLRAQYDTHGSLNDHPAVQQLIENDLQQISEKINPVL